MGFPSMCFRRKRIAKKAPNEYCINFREPLESGRSISERARVKPELAGPPRFRTTPTVT